MAREKEGASKIRGSVGAQTTLRKIRWKVGQGLILLTIPEFVLAEAQNQIVLNE